jgi:Fe2+ or Zn2+ uptake regulation protein
VTASSARRRAPARPEPAPPLTRPEIIEDVARRLRARGERMTGPRRAVLGVLAGQADHLSAEDVVAAVTRLDVGVHRASVYRTLEALTELGVVQHVHVGHGGTAYHLVRDDGPHLHAQCRVCGAVTDLPADLLEGVATRMARHHGFILDAGHVALSGVCADCHDA